MEQYLEIADEIDRCDFQINVMTGQEGEENELAEVKDKKAKLETELLPFREKLNEKNIDKADPIRIGYIAVFNNFISSFEKAAGWGKLVDLHQSMINPGYLLGMPVHDLFSVLSSEGNITPISFLGISNKKWDSDLLLNTIKDFRNKIINNQFFDLLEAVNFYIEFRSAIRGIADKLRTDRVIY